jgi:hypothetical protein
MNLIRINNFIHLKVEILKTSKLQNFKTSKLQNFKKSIVKKLHNIQVLHHKCI